MSAPIKPQQALNNPIFRASITEFPFINCHTNATKKKEREKLKINIQLFDIDLLL